MVQAKFLKRPIARCSQPYLKVVPLILAAILQVDADGKSVSCESYNQSDTVLYRLRTVRSPDINSDCVEFFGAFHNGLIRILYNSLQEIFKFPSGFLFNQICYALDYDWSLQPLNKQPKCGRFLG